MIYYYSVNSESIIWSIDIPLNFLLQNDEECESLAEEIVKTLSLGHDSEGELKENTSYANTITINLYTSRKDSKPFFKVEVQVFHGIYIDYTLSTHNSARVY